MLHGKIMGVGNFIVSSNNPASGWSDPVTVNIGGIDPSILFDGGRAYYCTTRAVKIPGNQYRQSRLMLIQAKCLAI